MVGVVTCSEVIGNESVKCADEPSVVSDKCTGAVFVFVIYGVGVVIGPVGVVVFVASVLNV